MFWADIVRDMTGWDPIADGRGYEDAAGARRALGCAGYKTALELVEHRLVEIPLADAMRGDLVYPADDLGPLGSPFVLDGTHAFSKCMAGRLVISRDKCVRAFAY